MKPMQLDAVRAMIALLGGAPHYLPPPSVRNFDEYDNPTHPLLKWVDELPPWQREQVYMHYLHTKNPLTQWDWDEAWAAAIYNALWY